MKDSHFFGICIIVGGCLFGGFIFCYMFYISLVDCFNAIKEGNAGQFALGVITWFFKELVAVAIITVSVLFGGMVASTDK